MKRAEAKAFANDVLDYLTDTKTTDLLEQKKVLTAALRLLKEDSSAQGEFDLSNGEETEGDAA